jgi:hypothetical protein
MPGAHRRSKEAKQLKTAGLVTIAVASLLMMMWAVFPSAVAFAGSGTQQDPFGPGDKVDFCHYDGSDREGGGGSGKYNSPNASATATGPAGHIGHAFDVIPSYFFQQNQNSPVEFFAGVNWPTLTNLPSSPVDFTPLIGSSASAFIAGGCGEPTTTTSTTPPPCPNGTTTVTATETTTVTETSTVTVTSGAPSLAGINGNEGDGGDRALTVEECATTTTETVRTTTGTTTTTTVPFCPEGSQTTTITETAPTTTTTVTVGDVPNQQPAECTSTETTTTTPTETTTVTTTPPVTTTIEECPSGTTTTTVTAPAETETVTQTNTITVTEPTTVTETTTVTEAIAGGPNPAPGLDQPMQEGFCHETTTTTPTVTETTTVNETTTVTSPTTVTETETTTPGSTSVAPTTITPTDGPTTDETVSPTTVTPPGGTAFTGVENVIPLGTIAVVLMTAGTGLLWAGSRRGRREED